MHGRACEAPGYLKTNATCMLARVQASPHDVDWIRVLLGYYTARVVITYRRFGTTKKTFGLLLYP